MSFGVCSPSDEGMRSHKMEFSAIEGPRPLKNSINITPIIDKTMAAPINENINLTARENAT
jgi:hypothetical protein